MGLVVELHGKSAWALQQSGGTVHGLQRITRVDGIDQVCNQFAIAFGAEVVTPALQLAAQGCVVVDVTPMQNGHARARPGLGVGALTEMGLGRVQKPKGRQLALKSYLRVGMHEGSPFLQGQGRKLLARQGACHACTCRRPFWLGRLIVIEVSFLNSGPAHTGTLWLQVFLDQCPQSGALECGYLSLAICMTCVKTHAVRST
jgi:hypothetical protein